MSEQKNKEIRWSACIWPYESPNLFIEYNGMDPCIIGWLMYKYGIQGFEYWNYFNSWRENFNSKWINWKEGTTLTSWEKGRFAEGDGLLAYPGPNKTPVSSIQLENVRDGFEDYRLWETSLILIQNTNATIKNILSKK